MRINGFPIEKAIEKHGNKYDYSKVEYVNTKTKVCIVCPVHGDFFQTPNDHVSGGKGCIDCGFASNALKRSKSVDKFIEDARKLHGDKYDYSKVVYKTARIKVKIICPIHGVFEQTPDSHLRNAGCPDCGYERSGKASASNIHEFIEKANIVHNNKYDYSKTVYVTGDTDAIITCPIHGDFPQKPKDHLRSGCYECGLNKISDFFKSNKDEFVSKAIKLHGDKYDYSKVEYVNSSTKVTIICKNHNEPIEFTQTPNKHLEGRGCPDCNPNTSKQEIEVVDFIASIYNGIIETSDRNILSGKELDIFLPEINLAIEYNGLYWHSEVHKSNNYHIEKTKLCDKNGIRLIHIFEDEWLSKKDIVKSRLSSILNSTTNKIYARKSIILEVPYSESKKFLDDNHIQGSLITAINIGLYYDGELVSLMSFNKPRTSTSNDDIDYELVRFANKINTNVTGGASKLLKYFIKTHSPNKILSYADIRWSNGDLYETLGFDYISTSEPNYQYIINGLRVNKSGYRKSKLVKMFGETDKSEHEIMLDHGIRRIYDCGVKRYVLTI